jgi:hypothetical protein
LIGFSFAKDKRIPGRGNHCVWKFATSVAQIVIAANFSRQEIVSAFFKAAQIGPS